MKEKIVIAYLGRARNGKDTAAGFAMDYLNKNTALVSEHKSFAKALKDQARALGWNGEKDIPGRTLLQELSAPVKRYYNGLAELYPDNEEYQEYAGNNYYPGRVYFEIKNSDADVFHITDMRYANEADYYASKAAKGEFRFITVRVDRKDENGEPYYGDLTPEQRNHESETSLNGYVTDYFIDNNKGLDEFQQKVEEIIKSVVEE